MTIIAYRNGTIACDSCWQYDKVVDTLSTKIFRLKSGALLGEAGDFDTRDVVKRLNSVKRFEDLPTLAELQTMKLDYTGLIIFPDKRVAKIDLTSDKGSAGVWLIDAPFTAIGSGRQVAIGAMEAGATARQAVVAACKWEVNCKLPVYSLSLPKKGKVKV